MRAVENGKVDKKAFDRICKFIDAQDKSGWPAGFQDDSKKICKLWLDDGHAPTAEFAAIASKMQLKNSRLWSFIDLVYNELGLLPEPDVMGLYDPEDNWAEIVPMPDSCPPVKKCKNHEVMSEDCAREAVSLYRMGQIAQSRLDAGEVNSPKESKKQSAIADKGTQALRLLVLGNLSMVINVAYAYSGDQDVTDAMLKDGQEGLTNAVILFVPKQLSFFAYAVIWVRKYILDGIAARGRRQEKPQGQEGSEDRDYSEVLDRICQFVEAPKARYLFSDSGVSRKTVRKVRKSCQRWIEDGIAPVMEVAELVHKMSLLDGEVDTFINLIYGDLGLSAEEELVDLVCFDDYEITDDTDFLGWDAKAAGYEETMAGFLDSYRQYLDALDTLTYRGGLSEKERFELRQTISLGSEAKESLVELMTGLIMNLARTHFPEVLSLGDLAEGGMEGAYYAIDLFAQNGVPFLTYAAVCICSYMLDSLDRIRGN